MRKLNDDQYYSDEWNSRTAAGHNPPYALIFNLLNDIKKALEDINEREDRREKAENMISTDPWSKKILDNKEKP